ncbi:MAG: hypothetical protein IK119_09125, partial [Bacteroidales bacterium]|nr:hypothetical protein [Bacteroidales bacterium]
IWTIFVYLCGTDLESDGAAGTSDLQEMLDGVSGDGVRFVVQTGGTKEWWNESVDSDKIQRYLVDDGGLHLMDQQQDAGMGKTNTLSEFLTWGVEHYASEHMGLVLWNHGGGCITGVCFDETEDYDSLSLRELDAALLEVCGGMGRKFDFIGFDACLMGTLEVANILASYSNYMIASEEVEPGSGWDYKAIGSYLVKNTGADTVSLGKVVCDSFLASCNDAGDGDICTLAVIDLSKLDEVLIAFNDFARGMFESSSETTVCAEMVRGITKADNFGGNNKSEGYTNMVDMGGIISACAKYSDGAETTLNALKRVVVYSVSGSTHSGASGLSMYYPLKIQGSQELSVFADICPSPYYISFVDRQAQGSVNTDYAGEYDEDEWFDDDGEWSWGFFDSLYGDEDEDWTGYEGWSDEDWAAYEDWDDDYWNYLEEETSAGESSLITFAVEPNIDEDGIFWFELDENGWNYAADVYGLVYMLSEDGEDLIELGETYDLQGSWEEGTFADDFDGWWISLPDGQNLATYIVEAGEDYVIYTSPILLNGEETNLRLKLDYTNEKLTIEGAWDGVSDCGALSREIVKLKRGDVITPLFYAYALEGDDEFYYHGTEYTFTGDSDLSYELMEDGDYFYAFCIADIYGDQYLSDFAMFNVEDGKVFFYEE